MKHADLWDDMERDEMAYEYAISQPNPTTCGFNNEKSIRECDPPIPDGQHYCGICGKRVS